MINFQTPAAFFLMILIPLLFILRKSGLFKRICFPAVLADWGGKSFEWKHKSQKIPSLIAKSFYVLSFVLLCLSLADPVILKREKIYNEPGTDIVFVMDTSPSMAAKDMDGQTRLDAAKNAIVSIIESEDGCGFGLVVTGSEAAVAVPPTMNHQYFKNQLDKIVVGTMGDGSAIGDGLTTAVYHLTSSSAQKKCIILLTDGENNAGKVHPETAARLSAEYGITLYVVGIGTKGTIPFEYTDPKTGKVYSGHLESNYSSAALRRIAQTGGGSYFEVRTLDELKFSLGTAAAQQAVSQSFSFREIKTPLYQSFLLAALILFAVAAFIRLFILKGIRVLQLDMKYKKKLLLRGGFLAGALVCTLLALSGISWGTYLAPVQKNSTSVAMVFDISHSMMAKDCPQGMTRMEASAVYAKRLLERMDESSVSLVIAKGDGTEIIPMTQDRAAVGSLLDVLSPSLMTVPGSSIGRGIKKALDSLPENFSSAGRIWVFSDGEETDGELASALVECLRNGVPVSIIGFGEETESAVLAGDGVTTVKTALRSEELRRTIKAAQEKYKLFKNRDTMIQYILYSEKGSAIRLLNQLKSSQSENMLTSYEAKPVPRYKFFLLLCVFCAIMSFIASEMPLIPLRKKTRCTILASFIAIPAIFGFSSCSAWGDSDMADTLAVLKGSYAFHQKQFQGAVAAFKEVTERAQKNEKQQTLDYALYNLGTTYAAMEESEAALACFAALSDEAPERLRFAAAYNSGILAHKNGDYEGARGHFRRALEIDSRSLEAKVNMELSLQASEDSARQNQSNAVQGNQEKSEQQDIDKSIFEHIKENDQKQWKNSEQTSSQSSADDF